MLAQVVTLRRNATRRFKMTNRPLVIYLAVSDKVLRERNQESGGRSTTMSEM
jgi:hypothetical protein